MDSPIELLLVEDNPDDAELTPEALEASKLQLNPILLDLNIPRISGREVLADIKRDPKLRTIPMVILTSSDAEKDVVQSYDLGANCNITKPVDQNSFIAIVRLVNEFWFTVVRVPATWCGSRRPKGLARAGSRRAGARSHCSG